MRSIRERRRDSTTAIRVDDISSEAPGEQQQFLPFRSNARRSDLFIIDRQTGINLVMRGVITLPRITFAKLTKVYEIDKSRRDVCRYWPILYRSLVEAARNYSDCIER